jgi:uncharacterized protein
MTANDVIKKLDLKPLPEEGGYYKEIYRAEGTIPKESLPKHSGKRNYSTSIYYLITPEEFSGLHRVASDEIFHFYLGDPVKMIQIYPSGKLEEIVLGPELKKDQAPQVVVKNGVWQGTRLIEGGKWALMGCVVAPGFEFEDFETKSRSTLIKEFPQHKRIIALYTHR